MTKSLASVLALSASLATGVVFAQNAPAGGACGYALRIATGDQKGTYSQVFKNIQNVCPLACEDMQTSGGFDNIMRLITGKADAGIAQVDALDFLKRVDPRVLKLRSLVALHTNSMHIIVSAQGVKPEGSGWNPLASKVVIDNLRQLRGKKVALFGSAQVTALIVSERLQLGFITVDVATKEDGLAKVKSGEVAAMLAMGGQPIGWVEQLSKAEYSLATSEVGDITTLGTPYFNTKLSYPNLNKFGVNSVTVRNDLVTRDFTGPKANALSELRSCMATKLQDIKEGNGAHAAWGDVEDLNATGWEKYKAPLDPASKRK